MKCTKLFFTLPKELSLAPFYVNTLHHTLFRKIRPLVILGRCPISGASHLFGTSAGQTVSTKYRKMAEKVNEGVQNMQSDAPNIYWAVFCSSLYLHPQPMHLIFICCYKVCSVWGLRQLQALEGGSQEAWSLRQIKLTNERPVSRSHDQYWPMRGQYWGHVTCIGQSEASDFWWRCIKLTRLQIKEFLVRHMGLEPQNSFKEVTRGD